MNPGEPDALDQVEKNFDRTSVAPMDEYRLINEPYRMAKAVFGVWLSTIRDPNKTWTSFRTIGPTYN